jgi:FtsP/CotA-like multicopper oxidase with cupredoxin domain
MAKMISRRSVLRAGLVAAAGVGFTERGQRTAAARAAEPDVEVELRAAKAEALLDPTARRPTEVWRYAGRLVRGPSEALTPFREGYLGPTFRVRPGQRVRVRFENQLPEASIVHWHGLDVPAEFDGHPRFAVAPGGRYVYDFTVANRPGTYWYHPHPDGRTGPQVYAGLAGLFIVADGNDEARGLPGEAYELPLVLQDRTLDGDGALVYSPDAMFGMLGDRAFTNGRPAPTFEVRAGSYRLRVLNGSNGRIYKLAWSDGSPLTVIGTDGGLLAAPTTRPFVMLAPGERVELWSDFGRAPAGDEVWLESRGFSLGGGGGRSMGGGMMGGAGPGNGAALRLCRFIVRGKGQARPLPRAFEPLRFRPAGEVTGPPRVLQASMGMMRWVLNGRPFSMMEVAANERVKLGLTEEWDLVNVNAGGMMGMGVPHPIHIHGGQFQVVSRSGAAGGFAAGLVDSGWKDTFLVLPGERVRVRVRFANHSGLFLYHCHILEHEDMGMMRNFLVEG